MELPLIEKSFPIYADNPINAICNASQFYSKNLIYWGYTINWDKK
ncbi:hypothetical protein EBME_1924 [bacterium endosymbiont of Mortierella elongata FMR23-6]|nr:hypothetical protein EBME_1924 [bacterium endosymbiont of Mortierella elongata FMR23-6]